MPIAPASEYLFSEISKNFSRDEFALSSITAQFARHDTLDPELTNDTATTSISELLYALKYHGLNNIGRALGRELGKTLYLLGYTTYDALVPVPIHSARKRERGYNQSEYIAQGITDILRIPLKADIVRRTTYTLSQTYFSAEERKQNVHGVFTVQTKYRQSLKGASILLVDDILTTGATLNACAMTLLEQGAIRVDAATAAKA